MALFDKFQNGWLLFQKSFQVMMAHKKLIAFPIIITGLTLGIVLFFVTPILFQPTGHSYKEAAHWQAIASTIFTQESLSRAAQTNHKDNRLEYNQTGLIYITLLYFLAMFLATFFNVAFYHEILNAFNGNEVSIQGGISFAFSKIGAILMWSLLAGLVGFIIRKLEERFSLLGKITLGLIGLAWSAACIFVIPVIIESEATVNPLELLKKSAGLLKKSWGESLVGYLGIQIGGLIALFYSLLILGVGISIAVVSQNFWIFGITCAAWLIGLIVVSYFLSVAGNIYLCALYLYASRGAVPAPYAPPMMNSAWKIK